jgi:tetratricopeptide (TPR) repeat protein
MLLSKFKRHASSVAMLAAMSASPAFCQESEWDKYTQAGTKAYEQGNYAQAEKMFKLSLKEAEKFGKKDARLATSLTNMGVLYNFRNQPSKAGPLFERAVAVKQAALGAEAMDTITSVGKLCQFYITQGNFGKSDAISTKIVAYAEKVVRDRQQVLSSFTRLTSFYQNHKEFAEAENLVKQAQTLTEKATSNQDLELAVMLDGLGTAYGTRANAEPLYRTALEMREQSLSPNHIALAASNDNLAKFYIAQNKFAQAEPLFRRSYEISQKVLGDKPELLTRIEALAQCLMKEGKYQEAESLYRHAVDTYSRVAKGNVTYVNCQIALGAILAREGRYSEAAPLVGQALKNSEAINGPQHASLSPILDQYADMLDKTNHKSEASKYRARAKQIRG